MTETRRLLALQLASTKRLRSSRLVELARLAGQPVSVEIEVTERDLGRIAEIVRAIGAIAVLADSFNGDLLCLGRAVAPVPVLRPLVQRRPGVYAGAPEERFCGYGLVTEEGKLQPLPNGALAP